MKLATANAFFLIVALFGVARANTLRGVESQEVDQQAVSTRDLIVADTMTTFFVSLEAAAPKSPKNLTRCVLDTTAGMLKEWATTEVKGKIVDMPPPTIIFSGESGPENRRLASKCNYACIIQQTPSCNLCGGRRELNSAESASEVATLANLMRFSIPKICPELSGETFHVTKTVTRL
jgi:hypothetical protein